MSHVETHTLTARAALVLKGPCARFVRCDGGATAIEYALIGSLIAVAIVVGVTALGNNLGNLYNNVADKAGNAMAGGSN
jgi:pilus assembly protein Flp/PilA